MGVCISSYPYHCKEQCCQQRKITDLVSSSESARRRFFVALLPPASIQDYATGIKQYFRDRYNSKAALRSPPHITLQPPFEWSLGEIDQVRNKLQQFAAQHSAIPIYLSGFGSFPPRVIYIDVQRTPELLTLHKSLMAHLEAELDIVHKVSKHRPFAPHVTVAFRDLKPAAFRKAWPEFDQKELEFEFIAQDLTLLLHNGQQWTIYENFPLGADQAS